MTTYDGELHVSWADLSSVRFDVLDPALVFFETIGRNTDNLDVSGREICGTASDFTELGCANRGEVSRMGEEDGLAIVHYDWSFP